MNWHKTAEEAAIEHISKRSGAFLPSKHEELMLHFKAGSEWEHERSKRLIMEIRETILEFPFEINHGQAFLSRFDSLVSRIHPRRAK